MKLYEKCFVCKTEVDLENVLETIDWLEERKVPYHIEEGPICSSCARDLREDKIVEAAQAKNMKKGS